MCFRALLNGANFCVEIFVRNPRLDFWKPLLFFICPKARKTSARHSLHQISPGGLGAQGDAGHGGGLQEQVSDRRENTLDS